MSSANGEGAHHDEPRNRESLKSRRLPIMLQLGGVYASGCRGEAAIRMSSSIGGVSASPLGAIMGSDSILLRRRDLRRSALVGPTYLQFIFPAVILLTHVPPRCSRRYTEHWAASSGFLREILGVALPRSLFRGKINKGKREPSDAETARPW